MGEGWDLGVLGIAAGRLSKSYGKPTIVLSKGEVEAVGSARSIKDYSIYDAINSAKGILKKFGGHRLAGGLTLKNEDLAEFIKLIDRHAEACPPPCDDYQIDALLKVKDLTIDNVKGLSCLEPFGHGNAKPLFLIKGANLINSYPLKGGKHTKIQIALEGQTFYALYFKREYDSFFYKLHTKLDLIVSLDINEFRGDKSVSIVINDLKPSYINQKEWVQDYLDYESIMRRQKPSKDIVINYLPKREEFVLVYKYLKGMERFLGSAKDIFEMLYNKGINFCKLLLILKVLLKNNLIKINQGALEVVKVSKKVNLLEDSFLDSIKSIK